MMTVAEAIATFGKQIGVASAAGQLPKRLKGQHYGTILEIGTLRGWSAVCLAAFADTVITVDIAGESMPGMLRAAGCGAIAEQLIDQAGLVDRVIPLVVASDAAKAALVSRLSFDLAFIDGDHSRDGVAFDFAITRRCGSVLFHDYTHERWTGIREFVDALPAAEVETDDTFAWWRSAQ